MGELKLECLVEGYEGIYFEVGQIWETKSGYKLKIKSFDLKADVYKVIMVSDDLIGNYYYTLQGKKIQGFESELDLVRLISTEAPTESTPLEEPQPKTLSEYLKENNAYESFVENCVNYFLQRIPECRGFSSDNRKIKINNVFYWECTEEGYGYWSELNENRPRNLVYDMNETIFKKINEKVNEKISEKSQPESILSEESIPKTLSEYLKENNAYESFVENCVEAFLKDLAWYKVFKSENKIISLGNIFVWRVTKEGYTYWENLSIYKPKNLVYDMNEIIFAEVDKRIAEQKAPTKYMVFVEGRSSPKKVHDSYDSAEKEAKRLSAKEIGSKVFVVEIVKEYKSKVIVEEV